MRSSEKRDWALPGWPWELELLALVFVILAVVLPPYVNSLAAPPAQADTSVTQVTEALRQQSGLLWSVGTVGLYLIHLLLARGSIDLISTPFTHLFAPLFFAMIAYYRTCVAAQSSGVSFAMATGAPGQYLLLALVVFVMTTILARLQMARCMLSLRQTKWDISSPTLFDRTYAQLIAQMKPLFYVPRSYRAAEQGILVEGWFYVMVIPFRLVQSISAVKNFSVAVSGDYFATSGLSLIRLELSESTAPLFISPVNRDEFLKYCTQHVLRLKRGTSSGTSAGANAAHLSRTQRISMGQTQKLATSESAHPSAGKA